MRDARSVQTLQPARPQNLGQMVLDSASRYSGVALQSPHTEQQADITYPELGKISTELARGRIALGIAPGDRVAILGLTSAEWTLADCGSLCAGSVVTPIYHTNSPEECAYVLAHSEARVIFCGDADQAAKIEQIRSRCPSLQHVVLFDSGSTEMSLDDLRARGEEIPGARLRASFGDRAWRYRHAGLHVGYHGSA